jgi:hypothetical protein
MGDDADTDTIEADDESADDDSGDLFFKSPSVHDIRLYLPESEREALQENARDEVYVAVDAVIDDKTLDEVGLRFKGNYGTLFGCFDENDVNTCAKLPMKLKLSEYDKA